MSRWPLWAIGVLAALLAGCGAQEGRETRQLTVLVAASAREPAQELSGQFGREHGLDVRVVADDSAKLAQQVVAGAPAQVFLSAAEKWADYLAKQNLVAERRDLLGNQLIIVVPKDNPAKVHLPEDLLSTQVKRVALAGPAVPAGMYARQALTKLKLLATLDERKKIVSGEHVRAALAFAERGEVEAAIVYRSDAMVSGDVTPVYTFPADSHEPILYPLVLIQAEGSEATDPAARELFDYFCRPASADVFRKHGFEWLGPK